ncbi:TVP38/TMEM64 family protein [Halorhabdus sp. CBA1104]|uniref:TVP38/TMEM64 family protein n=1 Tax=unclassified Halorhabdus TaxID=2621901 RepID=UPI0012B32DD5|nr:MULTISPECIES: VTT domain-containing protein [unclassified Halorhabdus]QGN05831.1 TVP38/TMEM64 family protein [Halorhabdus sp. CBA1104]
MHPAVRRQAVAIGVVLVVAALATVTSSPTDVLAAVEAVTDSPLAFIGVLTVCYAVRPLVLWPISLLSILAGYGLGAAIGVPVALVGAVLTCLPPYVLARRAPRETGLFGRLHRRSREAVTAVGERRGVVAARLLPVPADVISYGAGLSTVSTRAFVTGTFLGEIPWVAAGVLTGSSMRTLTLAGASESLPLLLGAGGLGILVLAGPTIRHLQRRDRLPTLDSLSS